MGAVQTEQGKQEVIKAKNVASINKQLDFNKNEWEEFLENIDFTDEEKTIIELTRRGFYQIDIAEELLVSLSTIKRRNNKIIGKIIRYILLNR